MLKVYASKPVGKAVRQEQQRAANQGIENVPARTARNVLNRRGGAGGRR